MLLMEFFSGEIASGRKNVENGATNGDQVEVVALHSVGEGARARF